MKRDDFSLLVKSVKQAGRIKRKELKPRRAFEFPPADVRSIRTQLKKS